MEDVSIKHIIGALGPLTVDDLKVLRIAITNAIEVSASSSDIKSLEKSDKYIESVIKEATVAGV
jgi:hypothetical protein